jgi:origin recognition complex subunit 2
MAIQLAAAEPRDYEIYFAEAISRQRLSTSTPEETFVAATAFDRSAVSVESIPPFDPGPFTPSYDSWFEILLHFSLLFYGFGSKVELLHDFATTFLVRKGIVVEVDGFSGQSRLLQNAIGSLCDTLDVDLRPRTMANLSAALARLRRRAFFVVNSLDSDVLSDAEALQALTDGAASPWIFVAASIDRAPGFSLSFYTAMQFYTVRVETARPYTQEVGFGAGSKRVNATDSIDRFSLVLKTLTSTANGIFSILLKHQLKTGDGLHKSEWLDRSISELCIRLQSIFRAQINEFLDHRLIVEKKGTDVYSIPLTHVQLQALLTGLQHDH